MTQHSTRHFAKMAVLAGALALGGGVAAQDTTASGTGGVSGDQIKKVLGLENEKNWAPVFTSSSVSFWR